MKTPDQAAFKAILIVTMIIAIVMLPVVAKAQSDQRQGRPAFTDFDADGDGFISEEEFTAFRANRMEEMAAAGKPMKGAGNAPSFESLDVDDDGMVTEDELVAGQKAHRKAMREQQAADGEAQNKGKMKAKGKAPADFADLDLDADGCISADEFAAHQAKRQGKDKDDTEPAQD